MTQSGRGYVGRVNWSNENNLSPPKKRSHCVLLLDETWFNQSLKKFTSELTLSLFNPSADPPQVKFDDGPIHTALGAFEDIMVSLLKWLMDHLSNLSFLVVGHRLR